MSGSVFAASVRFLRGVGNQAAVSVAASALAAAALALPGSIALPFFGGPAESVETSAVAVATERWVSPVASDGKIRDRHHDAIDADAPLRGAEGSGLVSPAAIMMPMSLDWTLPAAQVAAAPQIRQATTTEPRARSLQAQALPPRRPVVERNVATAEFTPLQIAPVQGAAVQVAAVQAAPNAPATIEKAKPQQRSVLGVNVPAPVSRMGDAVYGAVGFVGAAGSWTLSRASDLLPRL
ncbi:MAG TPA: hypothetical protein VGN82_14715 [Bosea sp. (in: a-proteobacteria)]|jgi:hypothetical protein|uniref:hypothetical protein n=1 Tax=Bosea sp. (in: a-proteobacteria) TaxID=1871050 RepID=UPI002E137546|nr:hypothetical protein [Bosea sp. (in: a-proteobacteria)]